MAKGSTNSVRHADADCKPVQPLLENLEPRLLLTTVSMALPAIEITESGGTPAVFTVSRDNTVGDLTVSYRVGGSEPVGKIAENLSGTVVIPAGSTSATISATPIDDGLAGYNNTLTIQLLDPDGGGYSLGTVSQATVRIDESDSLLGRYITVGPGKDFADPWAAIAAIPTNSGIFIDVFPSATGQYTMPTDQTLWGKVNASNVTIRGIGEGRVKMFADPAVQIANQKAIIVFQSGYTNFTMENLDLEGAHAGTNGAGLRGQGDNYTVRNCYFANNQDGILSDGSGASNILIEYSEFYNNGAGDGQSHNLYIGTGANVLTFQYNYDDGASVGHLLKSRAKTSYVLYNNFHGCLSESYEVSFPDSGKVYVIGNVIRQAPTTGNGIIVDYASETAPRAGDFFYVVNNTIVNDRGGGTFIQGTKMTAGFNATFLNNILAGPGTPWSLGGGVVPTTAGNVINSIAALKFEDAAAFDYHLLAGSPAIGAAVDLGVSVDGFSLAPTQEYVRENGNKARVWAVDTGAYNYSGAPTAAPGSVSLIENGSVAGLVTGSDSAGLPVTFVLSTAPLHGTLTFWLDGHFTYNPENNWNGTDTFQFQTNNGVGLSAPATMSLVVTPVNQAPTAVAPGVVLQANEDSPAVIQLIGTDVETAAANLVYVITTNPTHGRVVIDGAVATYTPDANYSGPDSFAFTVTDNGDTPGSHANPGDLTSAPATVDLSVLPVNDAPTAFAPDGIVWTDEESPVTIALTGSDVETPVADLAYVITANPSHGRVVLNGNIATYTPDANYNGPDSFAFAAIDTGDPAGSHANPSDLTGAAATVNVGVRPINDAPTAVSPGVVLQANEDSPLVIHLTGADVETASDNLIYVVTTNPTHGRVVIDGPFATYAPDANYRGPDSFAFTVTDNGDVPGSHANPGDLTSAPASVNLNVRPVNDAPAANNMDLLVKQDQDNVFLLNGTDVETATQDMVYDVTQPLHGTLTMVGNQATYTPFAGYYGMDSFQYTVTDNGDPAGSSGGMTSAAGTVSLTVAKVVSFDAKHPVKIFLGANSPSGLRISMTGPGSGEILLTNFDDPHSHDITRIELNGSTTATGLTIKPVGRAAPAGTLGDVVVNGSAKTITLGGVQVGNSLHVAGSLAKLDARLILPGADIQVGPAGWAKKGTQYKLGQVSDVSITSAMPIAGISAVSWLDTDDTTDMVSAPSLGKLATTGNKKTGVSGDFQADLNLSDSLTLLKSVKVAGGLAESNWNVSGRIGAVKVAKLATGSTILSGGDIRSITVGAADTFDVLASVDPLAGRHAVSAADFTANSAIAKFKVTGIKGFAGATFVNSNLSAASVGSVDLLSVDFASSDDAMAPFGVYAKQGDHLGVGKVRFKDGGKVWTWGQNGFSAPNGSKLTVSNLV